MQRGATSGEQLWVAATTALPSIDPLLADGGCEPDFFWEDQALSAAGFGVAVETTFADLSQLRVERDRDDVPGPFFGGLAFDRSRHRAEGAWSAFPRERFLLPRVLVWRNSRGSWMTRWGRPGESVVADVRQREIEQSASLVVGVESDRVHWDGMLAAFLHAIERNEVSKVVAARHIEVQLNAPIDVREVLLRLRASAANAMVFMLRSQAGAFLGATPECLCRVRGRTLETEALASSAPRDAELGLTRSDKDQREHHAVIDGLRAALGPLSERVDAAGAPRLLRLPYLTHLWTPLSARLREGVRPPQVVEAIFPSAAVGGTPRERALELIAAHERSPRGWYAGAIGWASADTLDLKVGIRSALIRGSEARVFVGAGIVAGSDPQREWQETELKARPMLAALRAEERAENHAGR